jgi:CheY-like chemotaxis protein
MSATLALSFSAVKDGCAATVVRFLGSFGALAGDAAVEGDLGLRRRDGYLVVRLRLEADDAVVARLRFWSARAGGNAAVADGDLEVECDRRLSEADLSRSGVAGPELGEALRGLLAECGAAPELAEVGSAGPPVLQLRVRGPGWHGLSYDRAARTLFVPTPLAPCPGDELVLQLETAGRPALRARARVTAAVAPAGGAVAGFSATLQGDCGPVDRVLCATCASPSPAPTRRAAQRWPSSVPVEVLRAADGDDARHGKLVDISCGGAFIRTTNPAPVGSEVRVQVRLPNETVETAARVVRAQPGGMGVEFRAEGGARAALASALTSLAGRRRRVLVVDDDALARRMLADAFAAEGFDVLTAPDARFAMRTLADQLFTLDLLVTDVLMPGMDGEVLVRSIRRVGGESDLPILVMSGQVDAAVRERLRLAGADAVVAKSLGADSIVRMAEGVIARRGAEALETVA